VCFSPLIFFIFREVRVVSKAIILLRNSCFYDVEVSITFGHMKRASEQKHLGTTGLVHQPIIKLLHELSSEDFSTGIHISQIYIISMI
jgi:hypothetical protein